MLAEEKWPLGLCGKKIVKFCPKYKTDEEEGIVSSQFYSCCCCCFFLCLAEFVSLRVSWAE